MKNQIFFILSFCMLSVTIVCAQIPSLEVSERGIQFPDGTTQASSAASEDLGGIGIDHLYADVFGIDGDVEDNNYQNHVDVLKVFHKMHREENPFGGPDYKINHSSFYMVKGVDGASKGLYEKFKNNDQIDHITFKYIGYSNGPNITKYTIKLLDVKIMDIQTKVSYDPVTDALYPSETLNLYYSKFTFKNELNNQEVMIDNNY